MIDILAEGVSDFAAAGAMDADPAALRKYLPRFERALGEKDFLAGDLSFADVLLFCKRPACACALHARAVSCVV